MLIEHDEPLHCEINYPTIKGVKVVQCFIDGEIFDESIKIHGKWYPIDTEAGEVYYDDPEIIH